MDLMYFVENASVDNSVVPDTRPIIDLDGVAAQTFLEQEAALSKYFILRIGGPEQTGRCPVPSEPILAPALPSNQSGEETTPSRLLDQRPASPIRSVALGPAQPSEGILVHRSARRHHQNMERKTVNLDRLSHIKRPDPAPRSFTANFTIPYLPVHAEGALEDIYKTLIQAGSACTIKHLKRGKLNYVCITGPTRAEAEEILLTAQLRARDLISGKPNSSMGVFVEPPLVGPKDFKVHLIIGASKEARPQVEQTTTETSDLSRLHQDYFGNLSRNLSSTLTAIGRENAAVAIRVHLGVFVFKRYQKNSLDFEFQKFVGMARNPRAEGRFKTRLGDNALAKVVLEFVTKADGPFNPADGRTERLSDLLPKFIFEIRINDIKIEADIGKHHLVYSDDPGEGGTAYQIGKVAFFKRDARITKLDISNLSLGKNTDWKMEGLAVLHGAEVSDYHELLKKAKVQMDGHPADVDNYPCLSLPYKAETTSRIDGVAVRSIYRLRWRKSPYIVEVSVNRRWNDIESMTETSPEVDLGICIYGDNWNAVGRSVDKTTSGNIFGEYLENLFPKDETCSDSRGIERVQLFLGVLGDIQDALTGFDFFPRDF